MKLSISMSIFPDPTLPGKLGNPSMQLGEDPRLDARCIAGMLTPYGMDKDPPADGLTIDSTYEEILAGTDKAEPVFQGLIAQWCKDVPPIGVDLEERTETIAGVDGNEIKLFITRPAGSEGKPLPCFYHTHGGGMAILHAADVNYVYWRGRLSATGAVVVGVEFRNAAGALGPHPFPAGLNDCYAGLEWTFAHKAALGISTIVITGESGGGNLALATTMKAQRAGALHLVDGVYAQCPYIAGPAKYRARSHLSMRENDKYFLDCDAMGRNATVYVAPGSGCSESDSLAWPSYATVEELSGLPPHAISVNELDPLRDEGLEHYRKLVAAGVSVYARTVNGSIHAGDVGAMATWCPEACANTVADIKSFSDGLSGVR